MKERCKIALLPAMQPVEKLRKMVTTPRNNCFETTDKERHCVVNRMAVLLDRVWKMAMTRRST